MSVSRTAGDGVYIVVEKILARGERLRDRLAGARHDRLRRSLNAINGLFVSSRRPAASFAASIVGSRGYRTRAADHVYASKQLMMRTRWPAS